MELFMSKVEKLINLMFSDGQISYNDAEKVLLFLGFQLEVSSSHHIFRKMGYNKNISIKKRPILLHYQIKVLREVLLNHGYEK